MLHLHFIRHHRYSSPLSPITERLNLGRFLCVLCVIIKSRNWCPRASYLNIPRTETINLLHTVMELVSFDDTQLHMFRFKFSKQNRYIIWAVSAETSLESFITYRANTVHILKIYWKGITWALRTSEVPQHTSHFESVEPDSQAALVIALL